MALISIITSLTLTSGDIILNGALVAARQIIQQQRAWSLHSGGLVVQRTVKHKHTCDLGICSCDGPRWCPERALYLVLQTYLAMQEVQQRMTEEASWAQDDLVQQGQVADGLTHMRGLRTTSIDAVAA